MRFIAQYQSIHGKPMYWRTIDANGQREAAMLARRYARKGYRVISNREQCHGAN